MARVKTQTGSILRAAGLLGVLCGMLAAAPAGAQRAGGEEAQEERETRETPAMSEAVYNALTEAQTCADMGDFECAMQELNRVRERSNKSPYETAVMWQFYAYVYFEQDDTPGAITAYENLLMQEDLTLALEQDATRTLSQLYAQEERYEDALRMLDRWFSVTETPGPEMYALRAQIFYQMERYADGIEPITTAIDLAAQRGTAPNEGWYQLLYVFYYETEDYPKVIETLRTMLPLWTKKEYLTQLAAMYGQQEDEDTQLALFQTAQDMGWLDRGSELVTLANFLLSAGVPYKAGEILQEGLDNGTIESDEQNWRMLATSWQQSQQDEQALPALTEAAELSNDPDVYHRLALSYANLARHEECIDAARDALERDPERPDEIQVTLGNCLAQLNRYEEALTAFRAASRDQRSRRTAQQFIDFVEGEMSRRSQIQRAIEDLQAAAQQADAESNAPLQ